MRKKKGVRDMERKSKALELLDEIEANVTTYFPLDEAKQLNMNRVNKVMLGKLISRYE
jgi:hypothetical protein